MNHLLLLAALVAALASNASMAADAALLARGEEIVQGKCFICHGANGESSTPVFPRLAGQHATYVARQLADFQSGRRRSAAMQPMVADLNGEDLKALGAFFEAQPVQAHPVANQELAAQGRMVFEKGNKAAGVQACTACHGDLGQGTEELPRLAGQHALYLETQLRAFGQRMRTNDSAVMQRIASRLSEAEVRALAAYISGLR
jgi:cytochrome c553